MRILLVEDDHQLGESLEAALRLEQYAVDWLRSGEPVRAALAATPYDLLILDLGLPGVPGMLVLQAIAGGQAQFAGVAADRPQYGGRQGRWP